MIPPCWGLHQPSWEEDFKRIRFIHRFFERNIKHGKSKHYGVDKEEDNIIRISRKLSFPYEVKWEVIAYLGTPLVVGKLEKKKPVPHP